MNASMLGLSLMWITIGLSILFLASDKLIRILIFERGKMFE